MVPVESEAGEESDKSIYQAQRETFRHVKCMLNVRASPAKASTHLLAWALSKDFHLVESDERFKQLSESVPSIPEHYKVLIPPADLRPATGLGTIKQLRKGVSLMFTPIHMPELLVRKRGERYCYLVPPVGCKDPSDASTGDALYALTKTMVNWCMARSFLAGDLHNGSAPIHPAYMLFLNYQFLLDNASGGKSQRVQDRELPAEMWLAMQVSQQNLYEEEPSDYVSEGMGRTCTDGWLEAAFPRADKDYWNLQSSDLYRQLQEQYKAELALVSWGSNSLRTKRVIDHHLSSLVESPWTDGLDKVDPAVLGQMIFACPAGLYGAKVWTYDEFFGRLEWGSMDSTRCIPAPDPMMHTGAARAWAQGVEDQCSARGRSRAVYSMPNGSLRTYFWVVGAGPDDIPFKATIVSLIAAWMDKAEDTSDYIRTLANFVGMTADDYHKTLITQNIQIGSEWFNSDIAALRAYCMRRVKSPTFTSLPTSQTCSGELKFFPLFLRHLYEAQDQGRVGIARHNFVPPSGVVHCFCHRAQKHEESASAGPVSAGGSSSGSRILYECDSEYCEYMIGMEAKKQSEWPAYITAGEDVRDPIDLYSLESVLSIIDGPMRKTLSYLSGSDNFTFA